MFLITLHFYKNQILATYLLLIPVLSLAFAYEPGISILG